MNNRSLLEQPAKSRNEQFTSEYTLGIDIGKPFIRFGVVSNKNKLIHKQAISYNSSDGISDLFGNIIREINELRRVYSIKGIGISSPGLDDEERLAAVISTTTGIPVKIDNNVSCVFNAETAYYNNKSPKTLIAIIGTTSSGGIAISGKFLGGESSKKCNRDQVATLGDKGALSCAGRSGGYISAEYLVEAVRDILVDNNVDAFGEFGCNAEGLNGDLILSFCGNGSVVAKKALKTSSKCIFCLLNALIEGCGAERIVVSGGIPGSKERFIKSFRTYGTANKCQVEISKIRHDAAIIGAAMLIS